MDAVHIGLDAAEGGSPRQPAAQPARQPPKEVFAALLAAMEDLSRKPADRTTVAADGPEQRARMLESLVERSPDVVLRLDAGGCVAYANPAAAPFLAACGARVGERIPGHLGDLVREAGEFGMARAEELEVGGRLHDVNLVPEGSSGHVNLYAVDITRRRDAEAKLRRSMEQAITLMVRAIGKRDPHSAGHQQRVARLAAAIATEMGMGADQVEGVRLGALVHDIGKIHAPAGLLARPGKLRATQVELVRQHPQAGFEILRDAEFPWPVAQMVLQHHERLDGSGYPQGLKGEAILPEARIIAVADVVDGISSHRPHRPALGLEAALREVERMRGRWLDAEAVDACLRLFREKGFTLAA